MRNKLLKSMDTFKDILGKNSPAILTGLGIVGFVTTTVVAVKVTPKALLVREEYKYNLANVDEAEDVKEIKKDFTINMAKIYGPSIALGIVSGVCIIGSHKIQTNRMAALTGLYSIAEKTALRYQQQLENQLPEKKVKKAQENTAQEILDENPVQSNTVIKNTGKGSTLCYDELSAQYFYSSMIEIEAGINRANKTLMNEMWIDLNSVYYEIGAETNKLGSKLGFDIDNLIEVSFNTAIANNDEPCLVVQWRYLPKSVR